MLQFVGSETMTACAPHVRDAVVSTSCTPPLRKKHCLGFIASFGLSRTPAAQRTLQNCNRVDLPRFSGQLRAVGTSTEVRDSRWK